MKRPESPFCCRHGRPSVAAVAVAVSALLVPSLDWAPAAEFRLRPQCAVDGPLVTLGDVAEILSTDSTLAAELGAIELFPSPNAPGQRFLRLREIQDLLLLRGVNLTEHRFSGSSQVTVLSSSQPTGGEAQRALPQAVARMANRQVCNAVTKYLHDQVSADSQWAVELELTPIQLRSVALPGRKITIAGGRPPWTGRQRFQIVVDLPHGPVSFDLEARVALPSAVVVAARSLSRGVVIGASDVRLQRGVRLDGAAAGFHSIEDVIGLETARAIPVGKLLGKESVRHPLLVRRGEVVTVYARCSGIQVRTNARSRDEGSLGDLVAVESLLDRQRFFARVSGVREVEVFARSLRARRADAGVPLAAGQPVPHATSTKRPTLADKQPMVPGERYVKGRNR